MKPVRLLALVALCHLCSGCATAYLWKSSSLADFNEPAAKPQLRVFEAPAQNDFLAVYDELRVNASIRPRAYLILANRERTSAARKPQFVKTPNLNTLKPVMLFGAGQQAVSADGQPVVRMLTSHRFALQIGANEVGQFDLPVYKSAGSTPERILVTPLAITADATVIGGFMAILYAGQGSPEVWRWWGEVVNGH